MRRRQRMQGKREIRFSAAFSKRLKAYATAAGVGAFVCSERSEATIIYTDVPDTTIGLGQVQYINLNNAGYNEFAIAGISGINQIRFNPYNIGLQASKTLTSGAYYVQSFLPGALIGPASAEAGGSNIAQRPDAYGGFYNFVGTGKYVGMKWDIGGGDFLYGWARVDVTGVNNGEATLFSYAYESDPNTAILAGQIPEPGTLALLAAGCGALALRRRRA